jgi:2-isopropylmalate synthase
VTIRLQHQEQICFGQASDTDIVVASAYAYMNALNRLYNTLQNQAFSQLHSTPAGEAVT